MQKPCHCRALCVCVEMRHIWDARTPEYASIFFNLPWNRLANGLSWEIHLYQPRVCVGVLLLPNCNCVETYCTRNWRTFSPFCTLRENEPYISLRSLQTHDARNIILPKVSSLCQLSNAYYMLFHEKWLRSTCWVEFTLNLHAASNTYECVYINFTVVALMSLAYLI